MDKQKKRIDRMNNFVVGIDLREKESFATYMAPDGGIKDQFSIYIYASKVPKIHLRLFSRICFVSVYCLYSAIFSEIPAKFLDCGIGAGITPFPYLLIYPTAERLCVSILPLTPTM